MKEFYDYKGKGVNQVRLLPPAPKEYEPFTQRMGRHIRVPNDVVIVDYIDLLSNQRRDRNESLMNLMQRRMKIYTRLVNRKRKITNLYETDKPNNVEIEENWGFY